MPDKSWELWVDTPVYMLSIDDIWPDGDAPENPTAEDVIEAMREYGSPRTVACEWDLLDELTIHVGSKHWTAAEISRLRAEKDAEIKRLILRDKMRDDGERHLLAEIEARDARIRELEEALRRERGEGGQYLGAHLDYANRQLAECEKRIRQLGDALRRLYDEVSSGWNDEDIRDESSYAQQSGLVRARTLYAARRALGEQEVEA
jgi:hypothetical protein